MSDLSFDRAQGALVGLAVGDALGTALEFSARDTRPEITDIVGGGPFNMPPGGWTDDTSMALCLAQSLISKGWDLGDQMARYCEWRESGYMSHNHRCFDIGGTVSGALSRYLREGDPVAGRTDEWAAGNGSLMRLASVPIRYAFDPALAADKSGEMSTTTHGAPEAIDACRFAGFLIASAIEDRLSRTEFLNLASFSPLGPMAGKMDEIAKGAWREWPREKVESSGYVIHTLSAALWAIHNSTSFEEGACLAVNLGGDADTTGAVYGELAGAIYGINGIPMNWRQKTLWEPKIRFMAYQLIELAAGEAE